MAFGIAKAIAISLGYFEKSGSCVENEMILRLLSACVTARKPSI